MTANAFVQNTAIAVLVTLQVSVAWSRAIAFRATKRILHDKLPQRCMDDFSREVLETVNKLNRMDRVEDKMYGMTIDVEWKKRQDLTDETTLLGQGSMVRQLVAEPQMIASLEMLKDHLVRMKR